MGQDVPLDFAGRGRAWNAQSLARAASDARLRRAAPHRRIRANTYIWCAGGNADRPQRDQTRLSLPGAVGTRPADGAGPSQNRGADRYSVHRVESADLDVTQGT